MNASRRTRIAGASRLGIAAFVLLALTAPLFAGFSGTDLFLASVGRGPGASNSQWYTTVWIANQSSSTATVQVMFLERKHPNPAPVTVSVSVPAGDTVRYANVLSDLFSFDNSFGALRFVSDQKIVVACRIFNLPAGGTDRDTQGQDYAGIPASFGISKNQSTQLLGVYQTSTDKSVSPFRYSFGLTESAGGTANVHVKALDGTGAIVAEKDYGPLGAYEVEYYPIEDLSPSISSQNLRLEVSMTDGTGKVIAVGSGVANQSNDGTTFEMQFADSLLGGGGPGGLSFVSHDLTLMGDGTASNPLGIANGAVVRSLNGLKDNVTLAAGANITITPSGNTLTIAATGGGGGGGVPSVNGITSAVTINGTGATTVSTAASTITVNSPASLPPSGAAGGSLAGTYPNPGIAPGAVGTTQIVDLAVTDAKVASGIAYAKLSGAPTSLPPSGAAGGDLAGTYPNPTFKLPYSGTTISPSVAFSVTSGGPGGYGVYGSNAATGNYGYLGSSSYGVWGNGSSGDGVYGSSTSGYGVKGSSSSSDGVYGSSTNGYGVNGSSNNSLGVYGTNTTSGNYGYLGSSGVGVSGSSTSGRGVYGYSSSSDGVYGESSSGLGVYGKNTTSGNVGYLGSSGTGVFGSSSSGYGVFGSSSSSYGVFGISSSNYAGYFTGNVGVSGTLSKGGGSFKIDHPLDPEHKYLYHSFVESPDMMNIYDGVVVTDANGEAVVELPEWFEALNRDFRYQLTVIGQFAQAIVAKKIENNRFAIKTNLANVEVSWQVTGIRKDPFANANRIPVEEDKPATERGFYLHPAAWGQPIERDVEWARHPDLMREMKAHREKAENAR